MGTLEHITSIAEYGQKTKKLTFNNREEAWEFMRQCDARGILAGYPEPVMEDSIPSYYTVEVSAAK